MIKISAVTLAIAIDTLVGSVSIAEGGRLFKYNAETRKEAADVLIAVLNETKVVIESEKE